MDDEGEFVIRPYVATVARISRGASYSGEDVFVDYEDGELVLDATWALPRVQSKYDKGFEKPFQFSVGYNPQQVARQLGYNQVTTCIVPNSESSDGFVQYL